MTPVRVRRRLAGCCLHKRRAGPQGPAHLQARQGAVGVAGHDRQLMRLKHWLQLCRRATGQQPWARLQGLFTQHER